MILFYSFISVIIGYMFNESPILGLFFYAILMYSCHLKLYNTYFKITFTLIAFLSFIFVHNMTNTAVPETLTKVTIEDYKYYTDSLHYVVSSNAQTFELYDETQKSALNIGSVCHGVMEVTLPDEERNFIKRDSLKTLQINELAGRIYMPDVSVLKCEEHPLSFNQMFNHIRNTYMTKVLHTTEHHYKFDILTLSIGNKNYITSDFFDALQKLGIYHLYVISGTHVAFVSAFIFAFLKYLKLPLQTIKMIIIVCLLLFLALNFFSPSVLRAVFMGVLLLVTSFFNKKPYMTIISLSALLQVLMNPYVLYHAGFQLSYITTYFILLSRPLFMNFSNKVQLLLITVISEISTLVIIIIHFNEISISGLVMNIFFVPLFSFVVFPSVIIFNILIFLNFPPIIDYLYHMFFSSMESSIYFLADAFKHRLPIKNMNAVTIVILSSLTYILIVNILKLNFKKILLSITIFIIVLFINQQNFTDDFKLTMVDVGQGDAFIIQDFKNKKTVLIDTGGQYYHNDNTIKLSDKTILPYLKEQGIDEIDLIIVSHLDLDHSGELFHILEKKSVGNIIMNTKDEKFNEWAVQLAPEHRSLIVDSSELLNFNIGNILFEQLYIPTEHLSSNEQSIVLKVHLNQYSILFTGDIGYEVEDRLLDLYNLKSDILKVSHHGSDTSTSHAFLHGVAPVYAMISAGVNNRYNHPHDDVLEVLYETSIINTQHNGMVEFTINRDTICIHGKLQEGHVQCLKKDTKKEPESRLD